MFFEYFFLELGLIFQIKIFWKIDVFTTNNCKLIKQDFFSPYCSFKSQSMYLDQKQFLTKSQITV